MQHLHSPAKEQQAERQGVITVAGPTDVGSTSMGHIQAVKTAFGQCPTCEDFLLALLGGFTASLSHLKVTVRLLGRGLHASLWISLAGHGTSGDAASAVQLLCGQQVNQRRPLALPCNKQKFCCCSTQQLTLMCLAYQVLCHLLTEVTKNRCPCLQHLMHVMTA